jgi:hypothetical protein
MITLSASLTNHQKGAARRPDVRLYASATRASVPLLRWARWYDGDGEADSPVAAAVTVAGTLLRARNHSGTVYHGRTTTPAIHDDYTPWNSLGAIALSGSGIALATKTGEITLVYVNAAGTGLMVAHSANDGATFATATQRATEASAIGAVTIAYNADGDLCLFYTLGTTTTLKSLRRTAGTWAGSGTTWSKSASVASLTGLAACWQAYNFGLIITGTEVTTTTRKVWNARMGDGDLPPDVWSNLSTITEADAASGTTYAGPAVVCLLEPHITYAQIEAGNVAHTRDMYAHPCTQDEVSSTRWTEPAPHEAGSAYGVALCASAEGADRDVYAVTPAGVWHAVAYQYSDELDGTRLISATYHIGPTSARARLELSNPNETLNNLPNDDYPQLFPGAAVIIAPGYASGTAQAGEFGVYPQFTVDRITYRHRPSVPSPQSSVLVVDCVGPWEIVGAWRAPQAWQIAAGTSTRNTIFQRLAARAGYRVYTGTTSSDWTAYSPAFAIAAGETGDSVLRRLLAVVSDHVRADADGFTVQDCQDDDASVVTYGNSDNHPILAIDYQDGLQESNWTRLTGPDRYDDAADYASVYTAGPRLRPLRNLDASTNAKATAGATGALRRATVARTFGSITVPFHAGQELYDVVAINSTPIGLSAQPQRVIGLTLAYHRGPGRDARYDLTLDLGGL